MEQAIICTAFRPVADGARVRSTAAAVCGGWGGVCRRGVHRASVFTLPPSGRGFPRSGFTEDISWLKSGISMGERVKPVRCLVLIRLAQRMGAGVAEGLEAEVGETR